MNVAPRIARRVLGAALPFFLILSVFPAAAAQELRGRVLKDGEGVAGIPVVLHSVTRDSAGVAGRTVTRAQGEFSFPLPPADTGGFTVFFATADFLGVRYFGAPLHPGDSADGYTIAVYDTISVGHAGVAPRLARRDVVLLPERNGGWEVNEIVRLENPADRTLVSADGMPTWEMRIPAEAIDFQFGEGAVAEDEMVRMGERLMLLVPLNPGPRELFLRYRIPGGGRELRIPVSTATGTLQLYVRQPAPALTVDGLAAIEPIRTASEEFASYQGTDLAGDTEVRLTWARVGPPVEPTRAALAITGVLLLLGSVVAWSNRGRGGAPPRRGAERTAEREASSADAEPASIA